jgi:hypothetical protein
MYWLRVFTKWDLLLATNVDMESLVLELIVVNLVSAINTLKTDSVNYVQLQHSLLLIQLEFNLVSLKSLVTKQM